MIYSFDYNEVFELESGTEFDGLRIAYSIYGNPNAEKIIWVCHALSGSSEVLDWWPGLFGDEGFFNPSKHRIVCANVLGGCYGTTGPESFEEPQSFPLITIKDMVKAHILLADHLGISQIDVLIGASLGGQQALEWAIQEPNRHENLILIATNAVHSPFGRAFNESQRLAIEADLTYGLKGGGEYGLKAARAIAMLSYRSYEDFQIKQHDGPFKSSGYQAPSYIRYQGDKLVDRFSAASYHTLTRAMDSHDILRGKQGSRTEVLAAIEAKTLVVGIDSDTLFPLEEQKFLANHIPNADLGIIESVHGHDSFLIDYGQLEGLICDFLLNEFKSHKPTSLKREFTFPV